MTGTELATVSAEVVRDTGLDLMRMAPGRRG